MLIDVGSRPVKISVDECVSSVIVRTIAGQGGDFGAANGLLTCKAVDPRGGNRSKTLVTTVSPIASLTKGQLTYQESRLPVAQAKPRMPGEILADPFEVLTVYQDLFTNKQGIWRLNFIVERHKSNERLWLITVQDESVGVPIVTLTAKDLVSTGDAFRLAEPTPLQRLGKQNQKPSAWDRILDDEDDEALD